MSDPDKKDNWGQKNSIKAYRSGARLFSGGLQMALAIIVFTYAGRWVDDKLSTSPWFMIVGVLVGAGGGLYSLIKAAIDVGKESERDDDKN